MPAGGPHGPSLASRIAAFVALARPLNALTTAAAAVLGLLAGGGVEALEPSRAILVGLTGFFFAAGANALNDAGDAAIDRAAHPDRPVPSGRLSVRQAQVAAGGFLALAVVSTVALRDLAALAVVATALVLEVAYEARLKRTALAGNAAVALLTAAPFLLGAVAAGRLGPDLVAFAGLAALATLGRELLKDVEDAPHDVGRATFAQKDPRAATRLAQGALALAVVLSPLPALVTGTVLGWSYLAVVAMADVLFLAAILQAGRAPAGGTQVPAARAQRTAKAAMLVALLALLVGSVWP